jgi:hypothetical protein
MKQLKLTLFLRVGNFVKKIKQKEYKKKAALFILNDPSLILFLFYFLKKLPTRKKKYACFCARCASCLLFVLLYLKFYINRREKSKF